MDDREAVASVFEDKDLIIPWSVEKIYGYHPKEAGTETTDASNTARDIAHTSFSDNIDIVHERSNDEA